MAFDHIEYINLALLNTFNGLMDCKVPISIKKSNILPDITKVFFYSFRVENIMISVVHFVMKINKIDCLSYFNNSRFVLFLSRIFKKYITSKIIIPFKSL